MNKTKAKLLFDDKAVDAMAWVLFKAARAVACGVSKHRSLSVVAMIWWLCGGMYITLDLIYRPELRGEWTGAILLLCASLTIKVYVVGHGLWIEWNRPAWVQAEKFFTVFEDVTGEESDALTRE